MKFIYLIKSSESNTYKIGISKKPEKRLCELQVGNSENLILIHKFQTKFPYTVEKVLHRRYSYANTNGEWFKLSLEEEINFIKTCDLIEKNVCSINKSVEHLI